MISLSLKMLTNSPSRSLATIIGTGVAFFLIAAQVGLLVGWCDTTAAIMRHSAVDVWVMANQTPAFDYGTDIPKSRIHQCRTVPGVDWAQGMYMGWTYWQRSDGRRIVIEMVGLDDDCVGGPWQLQDGSLMAVQTPNRVIVDQLYLKDLGVTGIGDEAQIVDRRAVVGAISKNVRTFTAAPWVFTSLETALKYDHRTDYTKVTYVVVRCAAGYSPEFVRDSIMEYVPGIEALTTDQFINRSVSYWMLETGIGITIVITAVLGLVIGTVIVSQTLYSITNDHLADYATLLAIGISRAQLIAVIVCQSVILGAAGICCGAIGFYYASIASIKTPVPLMTTPAIFAGLVVVTLFSCMLASMVSIRSVFRIDPVTVFRA